MAPLADPGVHERPDRQSSGRLLDRVPEVSGLRVGVAVSGEVPAHPVAEAPFAQVLLEHPEKTPALLVRQNVEHGVDLVGRAHREFDRPRHVEPVKGERRLPVASEPYPTLVLRLEIVQAAKGHVGSERLVEPDAVPPPHGHEVAEPHVCDLVPDDRRDALELVASRMGRIGQKRYLAERHAPQVLHGAECEVGDRDEVELVTRVGLIEVLGEEPQRMRARLEREAGQPRFARRVDNAERNAVHVHGLGGLERADDEGDDVGRHRDRVGELEATLAVGENCHGALGAVGDGEEVRLHLE